MSIRALASSPSRLPGFLTFFLALFPPSASWNDAVSAPNESPIAIDTPDFEKSLAELEQIVERLERGDLSLDESLQQFERGVQLTKSCQAALKQAEHKVEVLLRKSSDPDDAGTAPFEMDDDAGR